MDPNKEYDTLLSLDMDELGIRPANSNEKDFDFSPKNYFRIERSTDFVVCSAEIHFGNNGKKLTTNDEDSSMLDEDESNNFQIDPETGEKIFHETPLPTATDKWIEEYLSTIESTPSESSSNKITTDQTDWNLEDLSATFIENLNEQSENDWLSALIQFEETNHNILTTDLMNTNQISTTTEDPQLINETNRSILSIDDEFSMSSSSTYDQQNFISTLENDIDDNSMTQMMSRRTSTRSSYQGQQDEDALRQLNIPLSLNDITQSTIEEYNNFLTRLTHLTSEQIHLIKDIRRRGKNKIAAQNCRKRKAVNVELLMEEVEKLKRVKHELEVRKREIEQQIFDPRNKYEFLHHKHLPDHQLPPAITVK